MTYQIDAAGEEVLLKDGKFQVMMAWEKPYMEACIDALKPSGDVLEIGFGCGYSATHIQRYQPKSHTIIEYHPVVFEKAKQWASSYPNVHLVHDTWQNALDNLGVFDEIFFDDYPLQSEAEMQKMESESQESQPILASGKRLLEDVEENLPFLKTIRYSDQDLEEFVREIEQQPRLEPKFYFRFITDLEKQQQISPKQKQFLIEKLAAKKLIELEDMPVNVEVRGDRLFEFLEMCLDKHMRKGSRFSCYLSDPTSKFEDQKFLSKIILNPHLDYSEKVIPIKVPAHCGYYKQDTALVITVTKL